MKSPSTSAASAPFRVRIVADDPSTSEDDPRADGDLVAVYVLTWLACVLTTISAISRGETFGGEAALAALVVILIPHLLRGWLGPQTRPGNRRRSRC